MKRIICVLLMLLTLLSVVLGCTKTSTLKTIELNEVTRSVFYAPLYAGITMGFFEEEGMDIQITTSGGSDKSMTALLSGDASIALMGPETGVYVVNEGKKDHPMIIAQLTKRDGSFLIGRSPEADFQWENLRGKSVIGGRPGGMPYMTLDYLLKQHGLQPGVDVDVISNIQFSLIGGAFESGTGDYVALFEPTASQFETAGKGHIVANIGEASGEVPYTVFMVSKTTIEQDAAFVDAFVSALYQAQQWVLSASDAEVAEAMLPYFPDTDVKTLENVAKSYRETDSWTSVPMMTEDSFTRLQDIMENAGELTARVPFDELVDNSFGDRAVS